MGDRFLLARYALAEELTGIGDDRLLARRPEIADTLVLIESASQWARAAGRELQAAAPGAMQGALTGFAMGGPAGAALGAVAGGVGSRVAMPAGPTASTGSAGPVAANPAASQLLAMLLRPEVVQALGAMALGPSGAASIPVAGTPVPIAAFANLVATLAAQAAAQQHASTPAAVAVPAYLAGVANPTSPSARAEALLGLLAEAELDEPDLEDADIDGAVALADALAMQRDLEDLDRLEAR